MILVGNARGGGQDLANHLLKEENDHIEVHEVRHFAANDLHGAFREAYALSKATRARKYLFSLSINPPPGESVATNDFEDAIEHAEAKLGLVDQPRAIVFHEKHGRRHCHVVWSRIDSEKLKAIPMDYCRNKMQDVARELYVKHGWQMPNGFLTQEPSDPKNFTLEEWQQAKRQGKDPRTIKTIFQESWAVSDSRTAFEHALEQHGFVLARGDRRSYVALDRDGEVYALPKWVGIRTKAIRARLGEPGSLPSIDDTRARISGEMKATWNRWQQEHSENVRSLEAIHEAQRKRQLERHIAERKELAALIGRRRIAETRKRQVRFRSGWRGLWDRVTGLHRTVKRLNELEAARVLLQDRDDKDKMINRQLDECSSMIKLHQSEMLDRARTSRNLIRDLQRTQAGLSSRYTRSAETDKTMDAPEPIS